MLTRRAALALVPAALAPLAAHAQKSAWPQRPVKLVVTFIAGGANDIIARMVADRLSARFGQSFVIDNRAGAGGNIGVEYAIRQPADGFTFLQLSNAAAANASLYPNLGFDILTDLTPVAGVYDVPFVLVVTPDFPAKSLGEFIAYAKANPGKLSHGSGGIGSVSHVAAEFFKMLTETHMTHVPYRGSPQELGDLIGGRVSCAFDPLPSSMPYIRDGKLRALAVTSAKRLDALPDVPAIAETLKDYEATSFTGTAAPKGTPPEIVATLSAAIAAALHDPEVEKGFAALGASPLRLGAAEFGAKMAAETAKWAKVIKFADIKPE